MVKMNFKIWRSAREMYTRSYTIHCLINLKLKILKWYLFHLWYKLTKYTHKHIWNINYKCLICRKTKGDIDWEKYKK